MRSRGQTVGLRRSPSAERRTAGRETSKWTANYQFESASLRISLFCRTKSASRQHTSHHARRKRGRNVGRLAKTAQRQFSPNWGVGLGTTSVQGQRETFRVASWATLGCLRRPLKLAFNDSVGEVSCQLVPIRSTVESESAQSPLRLAVAWRRLVSTWLLTSIRPSPRRFPGGKQLAYCFAEGVEAL